MADTTAFNTVLCVKFRVLKHSTTTPSLGIIAASLAVQLVFERYAKPLARLLRTPLVLWISSAAYAGFGIKALEVGPWVVIDGRLLRTTEITAVFEHRRPDAVNPRRPRALLGTLRGACIPVRSDAGELAEFLGVPLRTL
jgi:hypothetical protein